MIIPGRDSWVSRVLLNWLQTEFSTHGVYRIFWERERRNRKEWKMQVALCKIDSISLRLSYWAWAEVSLPSTFFVFLSLSSFSRDSLNFRHRGERKSIFLEIQCLVRETRVIQNSLLFFQCTFHLSTKSSSSLFDVHSSPGKCSFLFQDTHKTCHLILLSLLSSLSSSHQINIIRSTWNLGK